MHFIQLQGAAQRKIYTNHQKKSLNFLFVADKYVYHLLEQINSHYLMIVIF